MIVDRRAMRERIACLLAKFTHQPSPHVLANAAQEDDVEAQPEAVDAA